MQTECGACIPAVCSRGKSCGSSAPVSASRWPPYIARSQQALTCRLGCHGPSHLRAHPALQACSTAAGGGTPQAAAPQQCRRQQHGECVGQQAESRSAAAARCMRWRLLPQQHLGTGLQRLWLAGRLTGAPAVSRGSNRRQGDGHHAARHTPRWLHDEAKGAVVRHTGRRSVPLSPGPGNRVVGRRRRHADDDNFLHAAWGIAELHKELCRLRSVNGQAQRPVDTQHRGGRVRAAIHGTK